MIPYHIAAIFEPPKPVCLVAKARETIGARINRPLEWPMKPDLASAVMALAEVYRRKL